MDLNRMTVHFQIPAFCYSLKCFQYYIIDKSDANILPKIFVIKYINVYFLNLYIFQLFETLLLDAIYIILTVSYICLE